MLYERCRHCGDGVPQKPFGAKRDVCVNCQNRLDAARTASSGSPYQPVKKLIQANYIPPVTHFMSPKECMT